MMSKQRKKVGILDTSVATENTGDMIIMEAAKRELEKVFVDYQQLIFPTHETMSVQSYKLQRKVAFNVACGTNLLHSHMGIVKQWKVGAIDTLLIRPVVLFGIGWRSAKNRKTDFYTKWLLKNILSETAIHSVRDSYAMKQLNDIGIKNVVNTGCPTTWILTDEHCREIPEEKGQDAVLVLTDYSQDRKLDSSMIDLVLSKYRNVYFWAQGTEDMEYFNSLGVSTKVTVISSSLAAYRALLANPELSLDYVGTRLHGGIYAMKHKRRSIIIGVDHRANEMGKDFNLPVVNRYAPEGELERKIVEPFSSKVDLPKNSIEKWCNQFNV